MLADSWYMLCPSSVLTQGQQMSLPVLGGQVTVSRDTSGRLLAYDDTNRERLVEEVNGMVVVWHGRDTPTWRIEPFPELESGSGWRSVRWKQSRVFNTSQYPVMYDVVDAPHFETVHNLLHATTDVETKGPYLDSRIQGIISTSRLASPIDLAAHISLKGRLYGMGVLTYRMTVTVGVQVHMLLLSAATPIDEQKLRLWAGVSVKHMVVPGLSRLISRTALASVLGDYEQDAPFWERKSEHSASRATELHRDQDLYDPVYADWAAQFVHADWAARLNTVPLPAASMT